MYLGEQEEQKKQKRREEERPVGGRVHTKSRASVENKEKEKDVDGQHPQCRAYPSDLTDEQWEFLEPLIPPLKADAAYYKYERREIVNGILYVLRSGCPWRMVPHDLPAYGTLHDSFRAWQREGVWDRVLQTLRMRLRSKDERNEEPSAGVIDSQSIKTSAVRGPEKGYDAGKRIWGRKRHALVDSQGNLLNVKVTGAQRSDQEGARLLLLPLKEKFPRMQLV